MDGMDGIGIDELEEHLDSLNIRAATRTELLADPDRAAGWIEWLREQTHVANPPGLLIAKFRTGEWAPDPNAWRGPIAGGAPDYNKANKACEALIRNTGHEYLADDLEAELDRVCSAPRIGNGATLTDNDRRRLLNEAAAMRARNEARQEARDDTATTAIVYRNTTLLTEHRITRKHLALTVIPRLREAGHHEAADQLDELLALAAELRHP